MSNSAPLSAPSVWDDILNSDTPIDVDVKDVEDTFSVDNATPKNNVTKVNNQKKGGSVTLLDVTRANNICEFKTPIGLINFKPMNVVAIMLRRIKLSLPEIKHALLTLDDSMLTSDDLRAISRQIPTPDEVRCFACSAHLH